MTEATYIPKGKIVPNWILRFNNKKKEKHKVKSNGFYVVRHKDGAIYMYPEISDKPVICITNIKNINIQAAPYSKFGSVIFNCKESAINALGGEVIDSRGVIKKVPNC